MSDLPRCNTCRFWTAGSLGRFAGAESFGDCAKVTHYGNQVWEAAKKAENDAGVRRLDESARLEVEKAVAASLTAAVQDGNDEYAILHTKADFGCVLHEAKS